MNKDVFAARIKSIPKQTWLLILIIAVGIFFRTYNFREWLYFYPDQARDVMIVDGFLSGKSSLPLLGFKAASTNFQLGAMYSYFQIISAKIFGSTPATDAYPDVFFGILSIPLLYYFLKRYFSTNISLALTGLYSVSFYAIRYSRFAWNINPIPFFVILFLLALHEFLFNKNKTHWGWIIALGIALGVGVQLHTVLLVLLPLVSFLAFVYTAKSDWSVWKKWVVIFLIALALNAGQILSETRTNFLNTKYFFNVLNDRSPSQSSGIVDSLALNVICHAQANVLYLSSLENNDNCDSFAYFKYDKGAKQNKTNHWVKILSISFGLLVFVLGYGLLGYYLQKEQDEKKRLFLGLNLIYGILTFLIILPIISHNGQVRYWLPVIFLPFLFLGLGAKYFSEKFPEKYSWVVTTVLILLIGLNFFTIFSEARRHIAKSRSNAQYVVLGELESINAYIISQSQPQDEAYVFGGQKYMQNFYKPLFYVASKNNFTVVRGVHSLRDVPAGKPVFFIAQNSDIKQETKYDSAPKDFGFNVESYKSFGNIGVYKIIN